jgi:aryl-alcohol dehydrogenase-like predicted oxidoreductase
MADSVETKIRVPCIRDLRKECPENCPNYLDQLGRLTEIAKKHGVTVAQVAQYLSNKDSATSQLIASNLPKKTTEACVLV